MHHTSDCAKYRLNPESHWLVNGSFLLTERFCKKYLFSVTSLWCTFRDPFLSGAPISVRHGDAGDAVAFPALKNWLLFGQKFSKFGQSIQLNSRVSEVASIFQTEAKYQSNQRQNNGQNVKIVWNYFAILFCPWWQNKHCPWVNWNRVVIIAAFIKFGPTKKLNVLVKLETFEWNRSFWVRSNSLN